MGRLRLSVIVAARDAGGTLPACLAALAAQDVEHEVVVVDDGSRAPVPGAAVRFDVPAGPSGARAAGVAASSGEVLAFTDADCAPAPGWLRAALAAIDAGADVVQGPVVPPPGVEVGPFDRTVRVERPSPLFECANLVVRRRAYERAGGFASGFAGPRPGRSTAPSLPSSRHAAPSPSTLHHTKELGEDVLLGWRLRRTGARVAWAPEAVVHHAVHPRGPAGLVAEEARLVHFGALVRAVPELRTAFLHRRLFLGRRHEHAALALAGVVACTRRPAAAALALPYARDLVRLARPWGRRAPLVAAARVTADGVGLAAALAGSARARTLVV